MEQTRDVQDAIIARAMRGDAAAFTQVLERYKGLIFQLAYQMSGRKDDALDITQEVFLKLYTQIGTYNGKHQFSSWVYRMAVNASIDYHRKHKRHRMPSLDGASGQGRPAADLPSPAEDPAQVSGKAELAAIFRDLADELPENQRVVFVLKDLEERDSAEVADILEITEATVRSHLHAARKKIRDRLVERHKGLLDQYMP